MKTLLHQTRDGLRRLRRTRESRRGEGQKAGAFITRHFSSLNALKYQRKLKRKRRSNTSAVIVVTLFRYLRRHPDSSRRHASRHVSPNIKRLTGEEARV